MAERDSGDNPGLRCHRGSTAGTPRWVKVFGVSAGVLVLLFVLLKLLGIGGNHGPGRHIPGDVPSGEIEQEAPGGDVPGDHAPPESGHP